MSCCSLGIGTFTAGGPCNATSGWVGSYVIIIERRREKVEATLREPMDLKHITRAHAAMCSIAGVSATEHTD